MTKETVALGDKWARKIRQGFIDWREENKDLPLSKWKPFNLKPFIDGALTDSTKATEKHINKQLGLGFSFNLRSPEAEAWIEAHAAEAIQNIDNASKLAIQRIILKGFAEGITSQKQAQMIREHIGLNPRQSMALENFRKGLESSGSSQIAVDKAVARYGRKLLNDRATTIALTEGHLAANEGHRKATAEATKRGILDPDKYERYWMVTRDKRLCTRCQGLGGARADLPDGNFEGDGRGPPLHVRCRCTEGIRAYSGPKKEKVVEVQPSQSPSLDKLIKDRKAYDDIITQLKNAPPKEIRTPEQQKAMDAMNDELGRIMREDAKTARAAYDELMRKARAEFPKTKFVLDDKKGFTDPVLVRDSLEALRKVSATYPDAIPSKFMMKDLGEHTYAQYAIDVNSLRINSKLVSHQARSPFITAHPNELDGHLKANVESGFHPIGCDNFESVVTHELGHALEMNSKNKNGFADKLKALNEANKEVVGLSEYSKYGNSKGVYHERFAEAFASLHHTPVEKQCAFVKDLKKFLDGLK